MIQRERHRERGGGFIFTIIIFFHTIKCCIENSCLIQTLMLLLQIFLLAPKDKQRTIYLIIL